MRKVSISLCCSGVSGERRGFHQNVNTIHWKPSPRPKSCTPYPPVLPESLDPVNSFLPSLLRPLHPSLPLPRLPYIFTSHFPNARVLFPLTFLTSLPLPPFPFRPHPRQENEGRMPDKTMCDLRDILLLNVGGCFPCKSCLFWNPSQPIMVKGMDKRIVEGVCKEYETEVEEMRNL